VLQACGASQQPRSTFVLHDPSEILQAELALKDVRVLAYERHGPLVEMVVEQVLSDVRCASCGGVIWVKDRPLVRYVDLPVYGVPMHLTWKKHRMRCVSPAPQSIVGDSGRGSGVIHRDARQPTMPESSG
jgi:hypothetical protein